MRIQQGDSVYFTLNGKTRLGRVKEVVAAKKFFSMVGNTNYIVDYVYKQGFRNEVVTVTVPKKSIESVTSIRVFGE